MLVATVVLLIATMFLFLILVCLPKLVYLYIVLSFVMLLGLSFYLLKNIDTRIQNYSVVPDTIFYND